MQSQITVPEAQIIRALPSLKVPLGMVDPRRLDPATLAFYADCAAKSRLYQEQKTARDAYRRQAEADVLILSCVDEREHDGPQALGLLPGLADVISTAGNRIGGIDEPNLVFFKDLHEAQKRAHQDDKRLMILFVSHFSSRHPQSESCAAWNHDILAAESHADRQVMRLNEFYVGRDPSGKPMGRRVVAFHLRSDTDTEARSWVGAHGLLDPASFVEYATNGHGLERRIMDRATQVFPFEDPRFAGLTRPMWEGLLRQITAMVAANVRLVIENADRPPQKLGHKGVRILMGRGWDMQTEVGKYFKVSDYAIGAEEYIAGKYVMRNGLLQMVRTCEPFSVPFHVNVPYEIVDLCDRGGSINHGLALARSTRTRWRERIGDPAQRRLLDQDILHALQHELPGIRSFDDLPLQAREFYRHSLADALRFYVSVSPHETRDLELVALDSGF